MLSCARQGGGGEMFFPAHSMKPPPNIATAPPVSSPPPTTPYGILYCISNLCLEGDWAAHASWLASLNLWVARSIIIIILIIITGWKDSSKREGSTNIRSLFVFVCVSLWETVYLSLQESWRSKKELFSLFHIETLNSCSTCPLTPYLLPPNPGRLILHLRYRSKAAGVANMLNDKLSCSLSPRPWAYWGLFGRALFFLLLDKTIPDAWVSILPVSQMWPTRLIICSGPIAK